MKKHRCGSSDPQLFDPDFAVHDSESRSHSSSIRQAERKTQQLCQQVKQALNLALTDRDVCDDITNLYVEDVSPAPDFGRLLVHVLIPDKRSVANVLTALGREAPRLRSEVASAITRKRAPELFFVPAYTDGGDGE